MHLKVEFAYPALQNNRHFRLPVSRYAESEVIVGNDFNLNYSVDKNNERNYTLPNVTIKARLRTEKPKDTHEYYSNNYADRKEIEERGFLTLVDILRDMKGIRVQKRLVQIIDPSGESSHEEWRWVIQSTRGTSTLSGGGALPILVDGVRIDDHELIMEMSATDIESVELLRAWQTLTYTFGAINGAIIVKTRNYKTREPLPSKGAMYTPTGLSPLSYPYKEMTLPALKCSKPGKYRLLVDVITESDVQSYERKFEVIE